MAVFILPFDLLHSSNHPTLQSDNQDTGQVSMQDSTGSDYRVARQHCNNEFCTFARKQALNLEFTEPPRMPKYTCCQPTLTQMSICRLYANRKDVTWSGAASKYGWPYG